MICLYGGFSAVIVSVLLIQDEENPDETPPVSPAMQCIIHLTIQFFAVYLALWLVISIRQLQTRNDEDFDRTTSTTAAPLEILETACHTVMFCPMLCILFLAARMRALQLTRNRGAPQGWAQDCMRLATWCVLGQLLCVLAQFCPGCMNKRPTYEQEDPLDALGYEQKPMVEEQKPMNNIAEFARSVFMFGLYIGAIAVVIAILVMNEETANGDGSWFFGREARTPYL
jgi:hypothetical protein